MAIELTKPEEMTLQDLLQDIMTNHNCSEQEAIDAVRDYLGEDLSNG